MVNTGINPGVNGKQKLIFNCFNSLKFYLVNLSNLYIILSSFNQSDNKLHHSFKRCSSIFIPLLDLHM